MSVQNFLVSGFFIIQHRSSTSVSFPIISAKNLLHLPVFPGEIPRGPRCFL